MKTRINMLKQTFAIFRKDISSEIRTRYAINSLLMFIVVVISTIKFSVGDEKLSEQLHAGIIWVIIFFTNSSGLSRVFVTEEERGTNLFLKLTAKTTSVLAGKMLFNIVLTFLINLVVIILYILVSDMTIKSPGLFALTMALGNLGLASVLTIIAALISKANTKGTLYPVLSFPLLLPLLLAGINSTWLSIEGTTFQAVFSDFQIMFSYTIAVAVAAWLLFPIIWND
jgi:heme exporter protein B